MRADVRVYCDASTRGVAGSWGAVVVRPGSPLFEASGRLRGDIWSSTHAEIKAAANAIHAALGAGLIKPGDRVMVYCDNNVAVRRIAGDKVKSKRTRNAGELAIVTDWIRTFAIERGFELSAKWVRGHQPLKSKCPHAPFNRRADVLCGVVTGTRKNASLYRDEAVAAASRIESSTGLRRGVEIARQLSEGVPI